MQIKNTVITKPHKNSHKPHKNKLSQIPDTLTGAHTLTNSLTRQNFIFEFSRPHTKDTPPNR